MKKGISKFWMEVILGSIVVAILLTIILFFVSGVTSGLEDSSNTNNFNVFTQTMAKAYREGEETIGSWKLETKVSRRTYAITYISYWLADSMVNDELVTDETSKLNLAKCWAEGAIGKDECICLLRVSYTSIFKAPQFNFVFLNADNTLHQPVADEMAAFQRKMFWMFSNPSIVSELRVLGCSLVKTELGCVHRIGELELPCYLFYNITGVGPRAIAWIGVQKKDNFNFEVFIMESRRNEFTVYLKPYLEEAVIGSGGKSISCVHNRHPCHGPSANCTTVVRCYGQDPVTKKCGIEPCEWSDR